MILIAIDKSSKLSLSRQIYQTITKAILSGDLPAGFLLPSTRTLSQSLKISRSTVTEAYELLKAERYIATSQGARCKVAAGLILNPPDSTVSQPDAAPANREKTVIRWDLRTGKPDISLFPRYPWRHLVSEYLAAASEKEFLYNDPFGLPALRKEIAQWLFRSRGIVVRWQDIAVTSGATQALSYAVKTLLHRKGHSTGPIPAAPSRPGLSLSRLSQSGSAQPAVSSQSLPPSTRPSFLVEDPCHLGIVKILEAVGATPVFRPVDEEGINLSSGCPPGCRGAYVTPSHQFPLGNVMSAARRIELVSLAAARDFYVLEDDYDGEFRYTTPPLAPLYTLAPERVIYLGTFSKTLFPALRIGYAILPEPLKSSYFELRRYSDVHNPTLEQAVLAEFLKQRKLDRHVKKAASLYGKRRTALLSQLHKQLPQLVVTGEEAGLHFAVSGQALDLAAFRESCRTKGLALSFSNHYSSSKNQRQSLILLGFSCLPEEEAEAAVTALKEAMEECRSF